jgi:hypothetical protein
VTGRALSVAVLAAAALVGVGCGSVTAKRGDGGGTGGSHADSSAKDLAVDRKIEDARHDVMSRADSSSGKDMLSSDARASDAHLRDARALDAITKDARAMDAAAKDAAAKDAAAKDAAAKDAISSGSDAGGACRSNGDCMLYVGAGSGCCGVCQSKSAPAPSMPQCLIACLTPLVTCGCVNQQCVGSKKML